MRGIRSGSFALLVFLVLLYLSPQKWGFRFCFGFVQRCQDTEQEALIKFKHSLSDPEDLLSSWIGENCCDWSGVSCDNVTHHILRLDLRNNNYNPWGRRGLIAQKLDPSLVELRYLEYLDLSGNNFSMTRIPAFLGSMKHLKYLNLSRASFSGVVPPSLGNLTRLRALDLHSGYSHWALTIDNLHWASGLMNLQSLDLSLINVSNAEESIQALSKLPSLLELRLQLCSLGNTGYLSRAFVNSTWLSTLGHLDLSFNSLQGPLPPFFANMTSLRFMDLSFNEFNGSIPIWLRNMRALEFIGLHLNSFNHVEGGTITGIMANLCKLKALDFSSNYVLQGEIASPHENFSECITYDLEFLDLRVNSMTGTLPYKLGVLKNLRYLSLEDNKFFGHIPSSIRNLSSLEELDLSSNNFSGTIPSSLGALSSLQTLDLSNNTLSGHIPESLGQCINVNLVDLSFNFLEGALSNYHLANLSRLDSLGLSFNLLNFNFSSDWVPPFQLSSIYMSSCRIQGELPQWIQSQHNLEHLDLSHNNISGKMPVWSRNVNMDVIDLSHNHIVGPVTDFPSDMHYIDLSHNFLSGPLPEDISTGNGEIGASLCRLRNLEFLFLKNNTLCGSIPHDCWADSGFLVAISLSFNRLSGIVPMSIWRLRDLAFLNLNDNSLEGTLPPIFSHRTSLVSLDLGENKLSGEVPSFRGKTHPYLQVLRLRGNQLGGTIPPQICSLFRLRILDLAKNNLTGTIPSCFGRLRAMSSVFLFHYPRSVSKADSYQENAMEVLKGEELEYATGKTYVVILDLSCNSLVGSMPDLSNLSILVGLNLSYNHLTGRILENIGQMRSLESLDLSNNYISGTIPASISDLSFLSYLNLSYNKLHGEIPTGRQLQTLNDPSIYAGNVGLCGDPLPNKCIRDRANKQPGGKQEQEQEEDNDAREQLLFYLVIMLGIGTGFWGVVGTLVLKKQWRYALFHRVEVMVDYLYVQAAIRFDRMR